MYFHLVNSALLCNNKDRYSNASISNGLEYDGREDAVLFLGVEDEVAVSIL
jgi:hypothetical protein